MLAAENDELKRKLNLAKIDTCDAKNALARKDERIRDLELNLDYYRRALTACQDRERGLRARLQPGLLKGEFIHD